MGWDEGGEGWGEGAERRVALRAEQLHHTQPDLQERASSEWGGAGWGRVGVGWDEGGVGWGGWGEGTEGCVSL